VSYFDDDGSLVRLKGFIHNKKPSRDAILSKRSRSQWDDVREAAGVEGELLSPQMPVPIRGDTIFGSHAVLAALLRGGERRLHALYVSSTKHAAAMEEIRFMEQRRKEQRKASASAAASGDADEPCDGLEEAMDLLRMDMPAAAPAEDALEHDAIPMTGARELREHTGPIDHIFRVCVFLAKYRFKIPVMPLNKYVASLYMFMCCLFL
jgi:hypothetical protein